MSKKSKSSIEEVDAETSFIEKYDKPYPSPNYKLLFGVLIVILLAFGCVFGVAIISIMGIPIDEFPTTGDDLKPVDTPYIPENVGLPIVNESNVSEGNIDNVTGIFDPPNENGTTVISDDSLPMNFNVSIENSSDNATESQFIENISSVNITSNILENEPNDS